MCILQNIYLTFNSLWSIISTDIHFMNFVSEGKMNKKDFFSKAKESVSPDLYDPEAIDFAFNHLWEKYDNIFCRSMAACIFCHA